MIKWIRLDDSETPEPSEDSSYDEGMAQNGDSYTDMMYGDSPDY